MILAGNKDMELIVDHCILPSQPAGTYRSGTLQAFHGFIRVRLPCECTSTFQGCQGHLRAVLGLALKE